MSDRSVLLKVFNEVMSVIKAQEYERDDLYIEWFLGKAVKLEIKETDTQDITVHNVRRIIRLAEGIADYRDRNVEEDTDDILWAAAKYITEENITVDGIIDDLNEKFDTVYNGGSGTCFKRVGLDYC